MASPIKYSTKTSFPHAYKTNERIIHKIIKNNVQCTNPADKIKFIPYYRSNTITSLITKNNQGPLTTPLKKTNVIYQYQCSHGDCAHHNNIIGLTAATLSRRLTMHLASGGPKQHVLENQNLTLTRDDLVNNTKTLFNEFDHNKLSIMEALLIRKVQPSINNQSTGINKTLKLSHSQPLQLLHFHCLPVFTHIVPTTYISIVITLTVLISMITVPITMLTVLIIVLTVPINFVPFLYLNLLHNYTFTHWPLMR